MARSHWFLPSAGRLHSDSFWPSTGGGDNDQDDDGHGTGSEVEGGGPEARTSVPELEPDDSENDDMVDLDDEEETTVRKTPMKRPAASAISKASATPTTTAVGDDKPDVPDRPPTPKAKKANTAVKKPAAKSSGPGCSDLP